METKAKRKTSNIIMIALIAVIVVCGVLAVGMLKGWFGGNDSTDGSYLPIVSTDVTGVANMERSNVGYTLEKDIAMQTGDIVETKNESEAVFTIKDKNVLYLGAKTDLELTSCESDNPVITLNKGEVFLEMPKAPDNLQINFGDSSLVADNAVFSVSRQEGSADVNVYQGTIQYNSAGETGELKAGKQLQISTDKDGNEIADVLKLKATTLDEYLISKLQKSESDLCFSQDELAKVVADREAEKKEAEAALEQEAIAVASGGESESGSAQSGSNKKIKTCTIQIQCKSILKNMDKLKEGKNRYVPANGIILATSKVEFKDGETAYDVTKRACSATGIQIEASYSPAYGSYYVEGINHLYEFDCGQMSGWMYKVNGWAPNYGCSEYTLKNGDSIVWYYTCTGN